MEKRGGLKWIIFLVVGFCVFTEGNVRADNIDWYITPGVSFIIPDADRRASISPGFQIGLGMPASKSVHLEFTAAANTLPQEINPLEFKQRGWSLDGLYFFRNRPNYLAYGVFGGGALQTNFSSEKRYRSVFNAGIGAISHGFFGDRLRVRTDLRYRVDESNLLKQDRFGDWVINVALSIPLKSETTSGEKESQRVPMQDRDGDGIPDSRDTCPSTAQGTAVDEKGCTIVQDSDGDRVPDDSDACPSTPRGVPVNESGCERDTDNDGVPDGEDLCSHTEMDTPVDRTGCPVNAGQSAPAEDRDGDGIANNSDTCPDTPAGAVVNANGCELDQDSDGIVDRLDQCPKSSKEDKVDMAGCKMAKVTVLKGVGFDAGSDRLLKESLPTLDSMAQALRRYPEMVVEIAGYSDNSGRDEANKVLSKKRADAVARYLIIKGVLSANLITKGYGKENPIASNKTAEGRALNRRVELHILTP